MSQSILTKIALNKELSWGVPGTATTAYNLLPVQQPSVTDTYEAIVDNGLRGIAAKDFGVYQGCGNSEVGLEGLWYPEEMGYLCEGILGSAVVTGAGSIGYHHVFTIGDQCPTFTIVDFPQIGTPGSTAEKWAYRYKGNLMSNLTIKFNSGEGAVSWTASFTGQNAGTVDGTALTVVGTPNPPLLGWYGSVALGTYGTAETAYTRLIEAEISISREVLLQHVATNTQQPAYGYHGPTEVTMTATSEFYTVDDYLKYMNNTQQSVRVTLGRGGTTGTAGSVGKCLEVLLPSIAYMDKPMEFDRGGLNVKLGWGVRAFYDLAQPAGTGRLCQITLHNQKTAYTV